MGYGSVRALFHRFTVSEEPEPEYGRSIDYLRLIVPGHVCSAHELDRLTANVVDTAQ